MDALTEEDARIKRVSFDEARLLVFEDPAKGHKPRNVGGL